MSDVKLTDNDAEALARLADAGDAGASMLMVSSTTKWRLSYHLLIQPCKVVHYLTGKVVKGPTYRVTPAGRAWLAEKEKEDGV